MPTLEDYSTPSNTSLPSNPSVFIEQNRIPLAGLLIGLILLGSGVLLYKQGFFESGNKVEVITPENVAASSAKIEKEIVVEIAGAVVKPGVYKLKEGDRIEDLLIASGGVSGDADREWFGKYINRAAKLADGQKLYIFKNGELASPKDYQSEGGTAKNYPGIKVDQGSVAGVTTGLVNINSASLSELDKLPGIGQVYGQSIIDHRPYSDLSELVSKGALKEGVYVKVKDLVSVY